MWIREVVQLKCDLKVKVRDARLLTNAEKRTNVAEMLKLIPRFSPSSRPPKPPPNYLTNPTHSSLQFQLSITFLHPPSSTTQLHNHLHHHQPTSKTIQYHFPKKHVYRLGSYIFIRIAHEI